MQINEIENGKTYCYARVPTNELIDIKIRTKTDKYIVGCYKGQAYLVFAKQIPNLLHTKRKDALQYLKEHYKEYKSEE